MRGKPASQYFSTSTPHIILLVDLVHTNNSVVSACSCPSGYGDLNLRQLN
jgi:hypothetical protein